MIDFQTHPEYYRHWRLELNGEIATLSMQVSEDGGLVPGYELKLNSYDLGVDIELYDAVQRLRFEHPEVGAVILTSARDDIFCAGANIRMLGQSSHQHKVNFCKFTNETRNFIEDAHEFSKQTYIAVLNGTASGGGYELALATDYILMADDRSTSVSLPEVPLLAVLPGTGGLTRLADKRKVRRDRADYFCTLAEGIKGKRAVEWDLVDEVAPRSKLQETALERANEIATRNRSERTPQGIELPGLDRKFEDDSISYPSIQISIERQTRSATIKVLGPKSPAPLSIEQIQAQGAQFWPLTLARELDDAILHLRTNEPDIGTWVFTSEGSSELVAEYDKILADQTDVWIVRETQLYLKRVLKRLDVTSRSLFALIEPGSCFCGTLLELVLAADRSYMLDGTFEDAEASEALLRTSELNFGYYPTCSGLTRLQARFIAEPNLVEDLKKDCGKEYNAVEADARGLITFIPDDIDWEDEVRIGIEERASFSPDALTGMEASLRFAGPETLETKIFGRLSAWQNWIFQRPNAVGEEGALQLFGTGRKAAYDRNRV